MKELKAQSGGIITLLGFKNVNIQNVNSFLDKFRDLTKYNIQFFNANNIAGHDHILLAALHAIRAFKKSSNISKSLAIEVLLYCSGQRQIKKAVKMLGINSKSKKIVVLIITRNDEEKKEATNYIHKNISGLQDDKVIEFTDDKIKNIMNLFDISNIEFQSKLKKKGLEIEALRDLILERMALLRNN